MICLIAAPLERAPAKFTVKLLSQAQSMSGRFNDHSCIFEERTSSARPIASRSRVKSVHTCARGRGRLWCDCSQLEFAHVRFWKRHAVAGEQSLHTTFLK